MQPALRIVVLPGEAQVDLGAALAQRFAAAEGVGLPLPGDLAAGVGGQARGVEVVAMEVEQGRVADLALGVVVGVDGGQRQAVQPQVILGSQFPAAAVVFGFAEQLAVGTVEVGGDALGGELDDALAEGVVAVFGDLLAVAADALQAALGVVGQLRAARSWVRLPAASLSPLARRWRSIGCCRARTGSPGCWRCRLRRVVAALGAVADRVVGIAAPPWTPRSSVRRSSGSYW